MVVGCINVGRDKSGMGDGLGCIGEGVWDYFFKMVLRSQGNV